MGRVALRKKRIAAGAIFTVCLCGFAYWLLVPIRNMRAQEEWLQQTIVPSKSITVNAGVLAFSSAQAARSHDMNQCFALKPLRANTQRERSLILACLIPQSAYYRHSVVKSETHGWVFANDLNTVGWIEIQVSNSDRSDGAVTISIPLTSVYLATTPSPRNFPCVIRDHRTGEVLYGTCRGPDYEFWNMFEMEAGNGRLSLPFDD